MKRKIVDMRSRPAFLNDFYGATPGTSEFEVAKWLNRRVGSKNDEHFIRSSTIEAFVEEVREVGITAAVVVGRDTPNLTISNDRILEITSPHSELIGIASVDPQKSNALAEIERAVNQLGLAGINIEPGFGNPPLSADDPSLYPIYDACDQLRIPVFFDVGAHDSRSQLCQAGSCGQGCPVVSEFVDCLLSRFLSVCERNHWRGVSL